MKVLRAFVLLGSCACLAARAEAQGAAVTVLAAASLTESFGAIEQAYEAKHPGSDVVIGFGGSSALVAQVQQGSPADVIATADDANMRKLVDAKSLAAAPATFAKNRLTIAVEAGNPKNVKTLADLAKPDLIVVLCAEQVPAGKYAREALAKAGVSVTPKSLEESVKAVIAKVGLGEADAGIAYVTDLRTAPKVEGVVIPDAQNVIASYPIAPLAAAKNADGAKAFVAFVLSAEGRAILRGAGFAAP
jgi:molybdate transport system substrate-binding protein